ncbi:MAG: methyltransferase domain-containing protein [Acidobacteria bacterium]|nr:methyltransferase domain-containing protein [Acidobacteriota bacterium]
MDLCPLIDAWVAALERRHLAGLAFPEVRRAVRALSRIYVERRDRLAAGDPLKSPARRAAYALFYGPLHFLLVREILAALGADRTPPERILDLGCGTGAAGTAWRLSSGGDGRTTGVDRNPWAVGETRFTFRTLGLRGRAFRAGVDGVRLPGAGSGIVAAFVVNELSPGTRDRLRQRLLRAAGGGARILVVEPIAARILPWWEEWAEAFRNGRGRADTWRFRLSLPEPVARLDRAAGLDHSKIKGRSLWLDPDGGRGLEDGVPNGI